MLSIENSRLNFRVASSLVVALSITASVPAQEPLRPTATPSESAEAAIARFVDECVVITPGSEKFPAKFRLGRKSPLKHELVEVEASLNAEFRICRYETTQELYSAVMGRNPSRWKGPRNSVEEVSFKDAQKFCRLLTQLLRERRLILPDEIVRLPTAVEWEYCCRAGTDTVYGFGDSIGTDGASNLLDAHAWHTGNAAGNDPAVGVLKANAWGLHDMHGYLWEFVDKTAAKEASTATENAVQIRGGSWRDQHPLLSSATYLLVTPTKTGDHIGFRCVIAGKPSVKKPLKR